MKGLEKSPAYKSSNVSITIIIINSGKFDVKQEINKTLGVQDFVSIL